MSLLDFNDPNILTAFGLLRARHGELPGLLQSHAQGLERRKQRELQEQAQRQQMEMQRMQMEDVQRKRAEQEQIRALGSQAFAPNQNLVNMDDEGNAMPSSGGGGMQQFAQGLMGINPMLGAQFMPKPQGPIKLGINERLLDPSGRTLVDAQPEKPKTPMIGQTREIKSGGKVFTYEWDGGKWNKIADAPQFKPDAPDKPEKPPQGYRWNSDRTGLEPIPGGPADAKVGKEAEAAQKREQAAVQRVDYVTNQIDKALKHAGWVSSGPIAGYTRDKPGFPAYNLEKLLDPIKANIGFAELQAMREASPTGGALGQVAIQELQMLQSVLGSLDVGQHPDQLRETLSAIRTHMTNWKKAVKAAREQPQEPQAAAADPLGIR